MLFQGGVNDMSKFSIEVTDSFIIKSKVQDALNNTVVFLC